MLLPKPKKAGVVSSSDLQVLSKALGVSGQNHDRQEGSTPSVTPVPPGRRSVLDNNKFGPGNRPYWEMKEGRAQFRYPDLIRALKSESDPGWRKQIGYKTRIFGSGGGTVQAKGASQ